ncbi:glycosyltransferase [Pseudomonas sp. Irchel s3h17]|uniref:glycosyltransferase n=1 Tax=Pseudomonas sp. Irchel s3h17 TaxID=2009182 RepID=UPI000BA2EE21|nr:glycosyltransferase [Pseudomonas sp. Irchel s3h17]
MTDTENINSDSYWNTRFAENWEACEGPTQSRFFARIAVEHLPRWLIEQLKRQSLTLADWGCAQGDGTDVWASYIDAQQIVGVDFSSVAIEQAVQRYPAIRFINEDWLAEGGDQRETFDIVFSSNTLEHFHKPYDALHAICSRAKKAIVLALPYKELDRIDEHFFSFLPENIPLQLANGFRLIWSQVVDCRPLPKTLWSGDQIILAYADPRWLDSLGLRLSDCRIEQFDAATEIDRLNTIFAERGEQNASLTQSIAERDEQNASLTQSIAERDEQNASFTQSIAERDEQNASFTQSIAERDEQNASLTQSIAERDEQNASLTQSIAERDEQNASLTQSIAERDEQLQLAQSYKIDKEIYIAQLLMECKMRDRGLTGILWRVKQRLARIPHYFNRSRQIASSGGFPALAQAFKLKLKNRQSQRPTSYILPTLTSRPSQTCSATPCQAENILERKNLPALLSDELVVITGVPFDDIGGGQRGAQLARCALKSGRKVIYIYVYQKFDFDLNRHVESELDVFGLTHLSIDKVTPSSLLDLISSRATILIEFPHPKIIPYLNMAKSRGVKTVFELIDDWETSLGGDWFDLDVYREFVASADVVVGTAKLLVQRLVDLGRNDALYLPNAANEYIFDKYRTFSRPADFPMRGARTAIYFGSLYGEWFAWDYVIAAAVQNASLDIILIGDNPGKNDLPTNIYFLGAKKIDELPGYLMHSDVAILPFVPGKISDAVSPIKVFEYLFAGKPVVSTRLPEILDYPGVFIADNPKHFAELCSVVTATEELIKKNDIFISQNSWFHRLDKITGRQASGTFAGTVSAVILIHNNINIIGRCLETLIAHGSHYLREIIVVDNASSDGGAEFIESAFPNVRVLRNSANGCSSGRNLGTSVAQGKYLAFFDSDQWFTCPTFFDEALSILERDASVGVIGWAAGWFDRARGDLGGMIADYCPNRAMNDAAIIHGYRSDIGYLGTGGFFVPKSVFDATDSFDTNYDPTCFEDTDLSFQIKKLGFKVCYRDLTGIRHQPHQTTSANSQSNSYTKIFTRNSEYFKKKWADHPEFYIDYPG